MRDKVYEDYYRKYHRNDCFIADIKSGLIGIKHIADKYYLEGEPKHMPYFFQWGITEILVAALYHGQKLLL